MRTQLPLPKKGGRAPPPVFGPCLLWPNGWMVQDATCYGGRPQPRRYCVRWGHSPHPLPKKGGTAPQFSAHVYCGQTAEWIKMSLGTDVGLGPSHIVRWGPRTPHKKLHGPFFQFRPMSVNCCNQTVSAIAEHFYKRSSKKICFGYMVRQR